MRFSPPPLQSDADRDWVLAAAFDRPAAPPANPERALSIAFARSLAPRLATRTADAVLVEHLGRHHARRAKAAALQALQRRQEARATLALVLDRAAHLRTPVVLLKGLALDATGVTTPGSRELSDIDLLLCPSDARRLHARLAADGFTCRNSRRAHQLPSLRRADHVTVDLHVKLPGVRSSRTVPFAGYDTLDECGVLEPLEDLAASVLTPALQLAHVMAHGLAHHGASPEAYPLYRMVADVVDLLSALPDLDAAAVHDWCPDLHRDEVDGCVGLACALQNDGSPPASGAGQSVAAHLAGAYESPAYALALKLQRFRQPLTDEGPVSTLLRTIYETLDVERQRQGQDRLAPLRAAIRVVRVGAHALRAAVRRA